MAIEIVSVGGVSMQQAGVFATRPGLGFARGRTGEQSATVAQRSGRFGQAKGMTMAERQVTVMHEIEWTSKATHEEHLQTVEALYFAPRSGAEQTLIFSEDGVNKRATVVLLRLVPTDLMYGLFTGEWLLVDQVYLADTATTPSPSSITTGGTFDLTNAGTIPSSTLTLGLVAGTKKDAADGQRFLHRFTPVNRAPAGWVNWPVAITDQTYFGAAAGWDHAALVTATSSRSDGRDVEGYANGVRQPVWAYASGAGSWNQTTTVAIMNLTMPPGRSWTYNGTATLGSGATSMIVSEPLDGMPALPFYAAFETPSGAEVVLVTAFDKTTRTLTIGRGKRDTSATTWGIGSKLWWCPVTVDLVYGWTSAPVQTWVDDREKPMMLASPSAVMTNAQFPFTRFFEVANTDDQLVQYPRSATWRYRDLGDRGRERKTGSGDLYFQYIPEAMAANPASSLKVAYYAAGAKSGRPYVDRFEFEAPCKISSITGTYNASTIRGDAISGTTEARGVLSCYDRNGVEEILGRYENSATTFNLTPTGNAVRFCGRIQPWDVKLESVGADEPADGDYFGITAAVVNFSTTECPIVIKGSAPVDAYQYGRPDAPAILQNSLGEKLYLYGLVAEKSEAVTIDVAARTCALSDGISRSHILRGDYPRVPVGTTTWTWTETGGKTIQFSPSFRGAWN